MTAPRESCAYQSTTLRHRIIMVEGIDANRELADGGVAGVERCRCSCCFRLRHPAGRWLRVSLRPARRRCGQLQAKCLVDLPYKAQPCTLPHCNTRHTSLPSPVKLAFAVCTPSSKRPNNRKLSVNIDSHTIFSQLSLWLAHTTRQRLQRQDEERRDRRSTLHDAVS